MLLFDLRSDAGFDNKLGQLSKQSIYIYRGYYVTIIIIKKIFFYYSNFLEKTFNPRHRSKYKICGKKIFNIP